MAKMSTIEWLESQVFESAKESKKNNVLRKELGARDEDMEKKAALEAELKKL